MADDIINPIGGEKPKPLGDVYKKGDMASVYGGDENLKRYFKGEECQVFSDPVLNGMCTIVLFPYVANPSNQYKVHVKQLRRRVRTELVDVWIRSEDFDKLKTASVDKVSVTASHKDQGQGWIKFNQQSYVFKEVGYEEKPDDIVNPIG